MGKLNVTPGEWLSEQSTPTIQVVYAGTTNIASVNTWNVQGEHNAQLIADAGNTYNQCGLLPSELLAIFNTRNGQLNDSAEISDTLTVEYIKIRKQRDELLTVLKDLRDGDYPAISGALWQSIDDAIQNA